MFQRLIGVAFCALVLVACQESVPGATVPSGPSATASVSAPVGSVSGSATSSMAGERPFKATAMWTKTDIQWAGQPGVDKSLFDGRCSLPSDYLIAAVFEGEATHAGHVTGATSHCSQIAWGPQGPAGATYSDGQGVMTSANGSTIVLRYGNGTTGFDPVAGKMWFRDTWTFVGGTGLFEGATGSGSEEGRFADFNAVLGGTPIPMTMEGTITYSPSGK
jgi:hypothetical protein